MTLVSASPAIAEDGTIYVGPFGGGQPFYALHPDGSLKWAWRQLVQGNFQSPTIGPNGMIYVESEERRSTFAFDTNGVVRWEANFYAEDTPAVGLDGTLYIGDFRTGSLNALNPSGQPRWQISTGQQRSWSPIIGPDGTLYCVAGSEAPGGDVVVYDNRLFSFTPDGQKKWDVHLGMSITTASIAANGDILITIRNGLVAISPAGAVRWTFPMEYGATYPPVVAADGSIYLGGIDGQFFALTADGVERWKFKTDKQEVIPCSPALTQNGTVIFGSGDGKVYAFSADGRQLWQFTMADRLNGSPAIAADGTIYFADRFTLYALKNDSPLGQHPWAKFGRNAHQSFCAAQPRFQDVHRQQDQLATQIDPAGSANLNLEETTNFRSWTTVTNLAALPTNRVVHIPIKADVPAKAYRLRLP